MATQAETVRGTVQEALPNTMFRVELENGTVIVAYLAGKMRLHRIKVLIGDTVELIPDPYGGKGRVVRRM
ncbi:translation initiation factor IF-1 [Patescibacteria group bacterium]|nr:translation initiation factor IF-1 [Patescibacteria group bacterium]